MTSTRNNGISGIRVQRASIALVVALIVVAAALATHLAGAFPPSHGTQSPGATRSASSQWTLTTLYSFTGGADGNQPLAGVIRDADNNLYGTTGGGGAYGWGVVFKLDASGNETVLYNFTGKKDGGSPQNLIHGANGNIFGATIEGGKPLCGQFHDGCGVVFKLDTAGNETVLHTFTNGADGREPYGTLLYDAAGNLYGTTAAGGDDNCDPDSPGCGIVYMLNSAGNQTVLYSFMAMLDGGFPHGGVIRDPAGNLYGTTLAGGNVSCGEVHGCGTVFKVNTSGAETVLYNFTGGPDGGTPVAGLIRDGAGNLYGTTQIGGASGGGGVVFKVDKAGKETVLYAFLSNGPGDGYAPEAGLVRDSAGNLYGTTVNGGASGKGIVFEVDNAATETILHSFMGGSEGAYSYAGLIHDSAGNLYGTTSEGGSSDSGTVFKLTPP